MDGFAARNMSQCSAAASRSNSGNQWCERVRWLLLLLQLLMLFEACGQWELLFVICAALFFTVEYIYHFMVHDLTLVPRLKKGQTIIFFFLLLGSLRPQARLVRGRRGRLCISPRTREQLSGLAPSFPFPLFLIELHAS
jgi:hypothetical protein